MASPNTEPIIAEVLEVVVRAATLTSRETTKAARDGLPVEGRVAGSYLGHDVAACELGGSSALLQAVDGVKHCFSTARAAVGERRPRRRDDDRLAFDAVVAVRIV